MQTRNLHESDHAKIASVVDEWWGRPMTSNLPKLFFRHFEDTSYVVKEDGELAAFLVGFVSQSRRDEAYIHFVGVAPGHRGRGVARGLYERFFEEVRGRGCRRVRCITSPVNRDSIAFHQSLGFEVAARLDYDGDGEPKVVFAREL